MGGEGLGHTPSLKTRLYSFHDKKPRMSDNQVFEPKDQSWSEFTLNFPNIYPELGPQKTDAERVRVRGRRFIWKVR